jgi:hypothetical protein
MQDILLRANGSYKSKHYGILKFSIEDVEIETAQITNKVRDELMTQSIHKKQVEGYLVSVTGRKNKVYHLHKN